ncbi:hypothetical protein QYM36_013546 [Artemia franciscana]|uniref:Uncharacterized protein n=1 Tax=Artemia franciscana TaxID=6661 RepID=A0AA88HEJ5_ARTSF|nr:hypothetical protein QYM36_013546 [Artemia franciscana]
MRDASVFGRSRLSPPSYKSGESKLKTGVMDSGLVAASRRRLEDIDKKFTSQSGLDNETEIETTRGSIRIHHLTCSALQSNGAQEDSPRFPRLEECAHFHYENVELSSFAFLTAAQLKYLFQSIGVWEDPINYASEVNRESCIVELLAIGYFEEPCEFPMHVDITNCVLVFDFR